MAGSDPPPRFLRSKRREDPRSNIDRSEEGERVTVGVSVSETNKTASTMMTDMAGGVGAGAGVGA